MESIGLYFDERAETASVDELRAIQGERLQQVVQYVYQKNTVQRDRLRKAGVAPEDIKGLDDLQKLPFMEKADFRANYPLGLACVNKKYIKQMHMSSGSTGEPAVMPYTENDLEQWAGLMARCLRMAGAEPTNVIQITPAFGLFNGGFGFYRGAEALGLFVLPTGSGNTSRQIRLAQDFSTRIITGVVSYGIRLMEVLNERGEILPNLEVGIFGAEPFSQAMKDRLSEGLGIEVFDIFGTTETGGVGFAMDCQAHDGLHVWEDQYLVEIVDRRTGEPVADGEVGELVVTSLTREALPVVRFRTGDLTRIVSRDRCACGRTHLRMAPIIGRTDDMLIIRGVNFFPSEVEQVLLKIPGVASNYQVVVEDTEGVKDVLIQVEADPGVTGNIVEKHLREGLGFTPRIEILSIGELPRSGSATSQRVVFRHGPRAL